MSQLGISVYIAGDWVPNEQGTTNELFYIQKIKNARWCVTLAEFTITPLFPVQGHKLRILEAWEPSLQKRKLLFLLMSEMGKSNDGSKTIEKCIFYY